MIEKITQAILKNETLSEENQVLLYKLGFSDSKKIWGVLVSLTGQADFKKLFPGLFPGLLKSFSQSFDPEQAVINFERFSQKIFDRNYFYTLLSSHPWLIDCLMAIFSGSKFITDIMLKDPSLFDWISRHEILHQTRFKDDLSRELSQFLNPCKNFTDRMNVLRRFKKREFLRIGIRDLLHKADLAEITKDISNVADVCLQFAYEFCLDDLINKYGIPYYQEDKFPEKQTEFCVLGMGKLGGQELNFSSDIDLIFIYTSDKGGTKGDDGKIPVSNHEFFSKLTQKICQAIGELSSEGNVFRVDLDLRPEGKNGDITNSLRSYEIYLESWGQSWERQALLKARHTAGSENLSQKFFQMTRSFIFRKYLDFSSIEEMWKMKEKINLSLKSAKLNILDVKLGYGGIREIEFIIQMFQLIYGARNEKIRRKNSLEALQNLFEDKYIGLEDYLALTKAYRFLRELEHRIQIILGLQTHSIPPEIEEQAKLARKMGISGTDRTMLAKSLLDEYKTNTLEVRKIYDALFTRESSQKEIIPEEQEICDLSEIDQFIPFESLKGYDFKDPRKVYKNLQLLYEGTSFSHPTLKSRRMFSALIFPLLNLSVKLPDPDLAINNLERYITAGKSREVFYSLLIEKESFRKILLTLFGTSEYFSNILIRNPSLIDLLSDENFIYRFKTKEKLSEELSQILMPVENYEQRLEELRKFKKAEELRICLRYLTRESSLVSTFSDLSGLAIVILKKGIEIAEETLTEKHGIPVMKLREEEIRKCNFSIIGMGKLGGRELDFGSDLDIVFFYEADGFTNGAEQITNQFYFSKLCEVFFQVMSKVTVSGYAYKIDMDLRPEGGKGVLIVSLERYQNYFSERASTWEKQALLKAQWVAGDENLGNKFIEFIHKFVYDKGLESLMIKEISEMRQRMEKERGSENIKNIKVGYGGIVDIEFAVQLFQLKYGKAHKEIRNTQTLAALAEIKKIGLISPEDGDNLKEAYLFYRLIENALRMQNENAPNELPLDSDKLNILARRIGFNEKTGGEKLIADYEERTKKVREIYQKTINRLS